MIRRALVALAVRVVVLANPPKGPLKKCGCGTVNEPFRARCIGCGASL
ncbi:hypothetical protein [Actinomadura hibisca]|nr:hypothetical protein [Actinomadura hibisca]